MLCELAGLSFRPPEAKELVATLEVGHLFALHREPANRYDPFAVQVIDPLSEMFIGYIPRTMSQEISSGLLAGVSYKVTLETPHEKKPILRVETVQ